MSKMVFSEVMVSYSPFRECSHIDMVTLESVLRCENEHTRHQIDEIRELTQNGLTAAADSMKENLPCYTPAGYFFPKRIAIDLKMFSGFLCVDIDGHDNYNCPPDLMKEIASKLPWVAYAGLSCRGQGVFVLCRVPHAACTPESYAAHYRGIAAEFEGKKLKCDPSCCNINRQRYASYDDNAYINEGATVFDCPVYPKPRTTDPVSHADATKTATRVNWCIRTAEIESRIIAPTQREWFLCGRALANEFGMGGLSYFLRISEVWARLTGCRHKKDPEKFYRRECLAPGNRVTIRTFFDIARDAGCMATKAKI